MSQKITPCLWFDGRAEEAADVYARIFKGKVVNKNRMPNGQVLTAHVDMLGTVFMLLNGGPQYKFSEAASFIIDCADQDEVDYYWDALIADGGAESQCAWCKDKFGVSWQVVPAALPRLLGGSDPAGAGRAAQAMFKMRKIIVADLESAYAGR